VQAGFPSKKIVVLPLFDHSEYQSDQVDVKSDYAVFVGRLDPEKGVRTLLEAWRCLKLPLKIRGSGRLTNEARAFVADNGMENVEFLEHMSEKELHNLIGNARFLISPSEGYYETFGLVIVESYSRGIPVVASNIGVTPELVSDGKTGLLFEAGNADDLAAKAQWLWDHPIDSKKMGQNALQLYKQVFASEIYYRNLIAVYKTVMAQNDSDF
jgi:glycosyltransferase involved in cell wall biosynthesis